ncbi:hypothetical protein [Macrococcus carouselicus]|uniref:Uncharacterized protein n=1 Tax=Macrococcus carouselicus TaxID=69969 RepID=A0A9Q8CMR5_9STAP|nr:hypothetical protein [Macrococcus carouselicus]TDM03645.1 hypothetical protein ERX40_00300 [Macrococcus carouselicus]
MIITLLLIIGLCVLVYYCNQRIIAMLEAGDDKNVLIWLYSTMISAGLIVGLIVYSMREQLIDILNVFYRQ